MRCGHGTVWSGETANSKSERKRRRNLLYVSDFDSGRVLVYGFAQGRRVRVFKQYFAMLEGICADTKGNIYVGITAVGGGGFITEYPHGKSPQIRDYFIHGGLANKAECSVDPTSGDLAVTNRPFLVLPMDAIKAKNYSLPRELCLVQLQLS